MRQGNRYLLDVRLFLPLPLRNAAWEEEDTVCDEFVPDQFKRYKCKACKRDINKHRRNAVLKPVNVLDAIDARGGESRVLGQCLACMPVTGNPAGQCRAPTVTVKASTTGQSLATPTDY